MSPLPIPAWLLPPGPLQGRIYHRIFQCPWLQVSQTIAGNGRIVNIPRQSRGISHIGLDAGTVRFQSIFCVRTAIRL